MNVLFLSRLFYPHIGGVEKHVLAVGKILIKKGHEITVLTEQFDKKLKKREQIEGMEVYRIPVSIDDWFKKFRIWLWIWKNKNLLEEADVIHCHDVFFWYLPFRIIFPRKLVFTTFHGYEGRFPPSQKAVFVRKLSEKLSIANVCVGKYISKWYGTRPAYVTFGGIEVNQEGSGKITNSRDRIKIVLIGRLDRDVGIIAYLNSLDLLRNKNIKLVIKILGDGPLRKTAEKYGRVRGFVKNVNGVLGKADILFSSSYLTILQGLNMKKLVFAVYDNPLKEDYLRMTPFAKYIIIVCSAEELVEKVLYYLNHPEEERIMVEAGYNWVKDQTWEKVANLYLKLWEI